MPNTESAKKRVRQTQMRNAVNNWRKRRIKDQTKAFLKALVAGDVPVAEAEYRKVAGLLDKIACTNTIHRNAAGRRKSRLAKRLNMLKTHGTVHANALPTGEKSAKKTAAAGAGAKAGTKAGPKITGKPATKAAAKPGAKSGAKSGQKSGNKKS